MHPEIIVSASAHSLPESVAESLVSKADYDALAERLAAAEADAETLRERINHYTQADELEERLRGWDALCVLAREAHPGTALVERLAQADAREAGLKLAADQYSESRDQWMLKAKVAIQALGEIDKHEVGACEAPFGAMPEPCDECGDMREIAAHALRIVKRGSE